MNSFNQKILIVDDIEDNRFTLERRLSRSGYTEISQADCGKKALEFVKEENFDLILSQDYAILQTERWIEDNKKIIANWDCAEENLKKH